MFSDISCSNRCEVTAIGECWISARNSRSIWMAQGVNDSMPVFVISFPSTCRKLTMNRLFSSIESSWRSSSSSSSLVSPVRPAIGSNGAVRCTRKPPSGWIHVSRRRCPSKRCSFSLSRARFFSSRFRWLLSYCTRRKVMTNCAKERETSVYVQTISISIKSVNQRKMENTRIPYLDRTGVIILSKFVSTGVNSLQERDCTNDGKLTKSLC